MAIKVASRSDVVKDAACHVVDTGVESTTLYYLTTPYGPKVAELKSVAHERAKNGTVATSVYIRPDKVKNGTNISPRKCSGSVDAKFADGIPTAMVKSDVLTSVDDPVCPASDMSDAYGSRHIDLERPTKIAVSGGGVREEHPL